MNGQTWRNGDRRARRSNYGKNHLPSSAKWFSKIPLRNSLQTSYAERFQDGRQRKQGMESAWLVNHRIPKPYSNSIDGM